MGRISTSPRRAMDEHLQDIAALQERFRTSVQTGLDGAYVSELQASSSYKPNLLPSDAETGHGAIHELVAVLRDGNWIHTRAENLVPGDVVTVKAGQCVPADIRLVETEDLWVNNHALTGQTTPLERTAVTVSVFDSPGESLPYMQAANMVFYGTMITQGAGKGVVCRTGAETVLGIISSTVLNQQSARKVSEDVRLYEDVKSLGVACKNDKIPAALSKVSAIVVAHPSVIKRTVVTISFGTNLPALVTAMDADLEASESSTDDVEAGIAAYIMDKYKQNQDANAMMRAMSACRHFPEELSRDQAAIARFCDLFHNPTTSRYSASLAGQVSGCEVYVHFDQECGAHIVVLQGPAREVLSRCGKVRKASGIVPLDTLDLKNVEAMFEGLESKGELVVAFAELYLDTKEYAVGTTFDIEQPNFPTANMVYLGALGLIDKAQPELVNLATHCQAADVNLYVVTENSEFDHDANYLASVQLRAKRTASDDLSSGVDTYNLASPRQLSSSGRFASLCSVKMTIKDEATDKSYTLSPKVVSQAAISISNTYTEWKLLLLEHPCVVMEGGSPTQIDLLVETLQDLGETVALVASGNANALSLMNADVGFAIPTDSTIDLSEDAADFVLGYSDAPRCDAVRIVQLAKRAPSVAVEATTEISTNDVDSRQIEAKQAVTNLFREAVNIAKLLNLSNDDISECYQQAMGAFKLSLSVVMKTLGQPVASSATAAFMTSMLASMAALKP
ncbi:E1E2 ATPase subfamily protein [Thraustotheca clavata]|uniref:E1E2 ATPase subfamily protein n=1 Tax=Thraustotheca clavata TaxID=74557 RepID=A0A1V9Y615_9STRA|nr:E1E2 ATPase subfamily protein [Thraustotheca clavata]